MSKFLFVKSRLLMLSLKFHLTGWDLSHCILQPVEYWLLTTGKTDGAKASGAMPMLPSTAEEPLKNPPPLSP